MKSSATTVPAYLDSLPPDRRQALMVVRRVLLENLDPVIEECMQYGVIGYCVPHSVWPHGHHTNPKLPLMYMGLSSQKNDMVVYMLLLLHSTPERAWLTKAWEATGRKSRLEVARMGCCLRFTKVEDLALDVIAATIRRMPVQKYLDDHIAMLARLGKAPDGTPLAKSARTGAASKAPKVKPTRPNQTAKKTPTKPSTKPTKKATEKKTKEAKKSSKKQTAAKRAGKQRKTSGRS